MKNSSLKYFVLIGVCVFTQISAAKDSQEITQLQDLIHLSQEQSETLKALELSIQSLEADIRSRDLELSAKLSTDLSWVRDRKETLTTPVRREDSQGLELTLLKPFASGTTLSLNSNYLLNDSLTTGEKNVLDWNLRLSQSLWKNDFGQGTRLRRESETYELKAKRFQIELQRQSFLLSLESLYWDLIYSLKEEEIRQSNIRRSETLEKWVRRRISRSSAEAVDLLQVQALGSGSRLDLIASQNRTAEYQNQLQQLIPGITPQTLKWDLKSLEEAPFPRSLSTGTSPLLRLDFLANRALEKKSRSDWKRTEDSLDPSLEVYVSYGKNGIDERFQQSLKEAQTGDQSETQVGILFSMDLDTRLKKDRALSGRLLADAITLQTQQLERASLLEWTDLSRKIENLRLQVHEARKLADFQKRKSQSEQNRLELGRSTVFQAVTFEIDAANAELRFYQTLAALRKTEARSRLFTAETGDL